MLSFPRVLLLAAVLAVPVIALDYAVDDFRPDFSGLAADTSHLDQAWGDTLKIGPRLYQYTPVAPYYLSDSLGRDGQAGGTPNVVAISPGVFRTAHVAWDAGHAFRATYTSTFPLANVVERTLTIGEGVVSMPVGTRIAGNENLSDQFGGSQSPFRPPTYFNYVAEGSRYAAYWGSMDPSAYIRRTTHKDAALGGSADLWGKYLFITPPSNPVKVASFGELSAAMIPGSGGARTVLAYETKIQAGDNVTEIRWEDLEAGTYASTTFSRATTYPEDYAVAADTAGNVVVLWREGTTLLATAYDTNRVLILPPTTVSAGITYKDAANEHYYRPYAIAGLESGRFLVAYTRAGSIRLRTLEIPYGPLSFSLSSETQLTAAGVTVNYPSIAVNHNQALVGWFRRTGAGDSLVGAVFNRAAGGLDAASRYDLPLSSETVSFSTVGSGWYFYHYFKAPSLALDPQGNIAAAYDNQFWAKLAVTCNFAIFHDSASFVSKSQPYSVLPGPLPFDDANDSLEFRGSRLVARGSGGNPPQAALQIAVSKDGSFTDPGSDFQTFPVGRRGAGERFKYRVVVQADAPRFITQTKVDSVLFRFNVQPRRPAVDSLRIGTGSRVAYSPSAAYSVLRRRDSLHVTVSGIDLENQSSATLYLCVAGVAVDSATAPRAAPARYRARFSFKPAVSLPDPLPLSFRMRDSAGWLGVPQAFTPAFRNAAPAETLSVIRSRGRDSLGVFWPALGARDTLAVAPSQIVVLQVGDSATAAFRFGDVNDDSLTFRWVRNGDTLASARVATQSPFSLRFAADTVAPLIDTLVALVEDPDTTVAFRFLVRPNRLPEVDSLALASYLSREGARMAGPFEVIRNFALDSGLLVPSGLPAVLRAGASDRDAAFGDGARLSWAAYAPPAQAGCPSGNLACYARTVQGSGDSLAHAFALPEEYLVVRATDSTGAFLERRVRLEFPLLDTAAAASFRTAVKALAEDLDFILEGQVTSRTVAGEISSLGNVPLQIHSVTTSRNDRKWLEMALVWEAPGTPPAKDSLRLSGRTDSNAVPAGDPLTVAAGSRMTLRFTVSSDSLRGDSVLVDTVVLRTNDLANPFIRIPIRMVYNDLPVLRMSSLGGQDGQGGPAGGYNDGGLPAFLPVRSRLAFAFSETVIIPDPARFVRVYSYLDSLANPGGYRPIQGTYDYRRRALPRRGAGGAYTGTAPGTAALRKSAADSLADTLIFRPAYDRPSDSLKVRPAPGSFIHRDILRIVVGNGARDRAGNALDLRLDKRALAPGTLDTIWPARVDTGVFRVASTVPAAGESGWDPDSPLRVRFNRKLGLKPPRGADSLTLLDLDAVRGDSNRGVWVRSTSRGSARYDFQFLALADGDSTLVFRTRPKLAARETVTVSLAGGILDADGLSLDGDQDGFPRALYNPDDTTDTFRFTFSTRAQAFYVFPNPFRHGDPRHAGKGSITFKNINTLPGFQAGREVVLRIHSMTGDLVYSSASASRRIEPGAGYAILEWNLRNNAGNLAGTGVYVYTLSTGDTKVLRKGKVAVIR